MLHLGSCLGWISPPVAWGFTSEQHLNLWFVELKLKREGIIIPLSGICLWKKGSSGPERQHPVAPPLGCHLARFVGCQPRLTDRGTWAPSKRCFNMVIVAETAFLFGAAVQFWTESPPCPHLHCLLVWFTTWFWCVQTRFLEGGLYRKLLSKCGSASNGDRRCGGPFQQLVPLLHWEHPSREPGKT